MTSKPESSMTWIVEVRMSQSKPVLCMKCIQYQVR